MDLKKLIIFGFIIQLHSVTFGQTVFDDCEIYAKWTEATIVFKSRDTVAVKAKYNPLLNPNKIEIGEEDSSYFVATETVNELSYLDHDINALRKFKNIQIHFVNLPKKMDVFSEVFFENEYFAITRSVSYLGYPSLLNPLGKASNQVVLLIINKMTGQPFKDLSKKTFVKAMLDKKLEIEKYIKQHKLKVYALDHQIKLFEFYAKLRE
jgi:hypothetical protein